MVSVKLVPSESTLHWRSTESQKKSKEGWDVALWLEITRLSSIKFHPGSEPVVLFNLSEANSTTVLIDASFLHRHRDCMALQLLKSINDMSRDSSRSTPLCLACSSSLPPRLWKRTLERAEGGDLEGASSSSTGRSDRGRRSSSELFLTLCCGRPICPSCVTSNPRLVRYNPCLACLGGVGAVGPEKVTVLRGEHQVASSNVDGAIRDEDVFIVGEEDEDEASETHEEEAAEASGRIPPPSEAAEPPEPDISVRPAGDSNQGSPGRYYIRTDDTLLGISLRLGVDVSATIYESFPFIRSAPLRIRAELSAS
jgi:hypothetical protein